MASYCRAQARDIEIADKVRPELERLGDRRTPSALLGRTSRTNDNNGYSHFIIPILKEKARPIDGLSSYLFSNARTLSASLFFAFT